MNSLMKIFKTNKPFIGALHFMPTLGYEGFTDLDKILDKARKDLKALQDGGVDGIIFENNYDYPHKIMVGHETTASMIYLISELKKDIKVPFGVSVLWNDYESAFSIAKICEGLFIRIPVFVDKVETNYGVVKVDPTVILEYRRKISAQTIAIFSDIHVKHAKLLSDKTITQSAKDAIKYKSDALIITGKWTAHAPELDDIVKVSTTFKDFPILVGSGATAENIYELLKHANGAIVSTSLKTSMHQDYVNVKGHQDSIDIKKVIEFRNAINANS